MVCACHLYTISVFSTFNGELSQHPNAAVRKIYSLSANGARGAVSCLDAIEQGTEIL